MRRRDVLASTAAALTTGVATGGGIAAPALAQGGVPTPLPGAPKPPPDRPAMLQAALPVLNFLGNDEVCDSWIEAQNVGSTFTRITLMVWGEPGDEARIGKAIDEDAPQALDYLESQLPEDGFLFGDIGLADISIASFFRNAAYADFEVDPSRWPRTSSFVQRTLAHPCIDELLRFEQVQLATDVKGRRQALIEAGARLAEESVGVREPRKGYMRL